jgi:hypothetical protein
MENSSEEKKVQRMYGRIKELDPKKTFIDESLFDPVKEIIQNQISIYEYQDPKFKRHRCKLLKKAKLAHKEIDYMVRRRL